MVLLDTDVGIIILVLYLNLEGASGGIQFPMLIWKAMVQVSVSINFGMRRGGRTGAYISGF